MGINLDDLPKGSALRKQAEAKAAEAGLDLKAGAGRPRRKRTSRREAPGKSPGTCHDCSISFESYNAFERHDCPAGKGCRFELEILIAKEADSEADTPAL